MSKHKAPSIESARKMGEEGGPAVEEERLAFEAWMSGHCLELRGKWDGREYVNDSEKNGFFSTSAFHTRQLWAAWRDRAALERVDTQNLRSQLEEIRMTIGSAPHAVSAHADLENRTWTFDIPKGCAVGAGKYALLFIGPVSEKGSEE